MKKCILIGGGNTGDTRLPYETQIIDKEIVSLANKKSPNFLFIGLASNHSDSDYDHIKKVFQNLECKTQHLKRKNIINNPDIMINKIQNADIIYIGGGDTLKLLEDVKNYHLDDLLKKSYLEGKVMVGKSAGAILLSKEGFSDSYILRGISDNYQFIKGLGIVKLNICPHYNDNPKKSQELKELLKNKSKIIYGIENQAAIKILDNKIEVISDSGNVYRCSYKNNWKEEKL